VIRNHLTFDDHMRCLFADDDDDDDHDDSDADDYYDKKFDASRGRLMARDCARIVIKRIHRIDCSDSVNNTTTTASTTSTTTTTILHAVYGV